MCEVCAIFGAGEHWSDFGRLRDERYPFDDIQHYKDERRRRIGLLNKVLTRFGVICEDWDGEALMLFDKAGRSKIALTLNDVRTELAVGPLAVALLADRLGRVEHDCDRDIFYIERQPETEQEDQERRHDDPDRDRARIAKQLVGLFAHQRGEPAQPCCGGGR